jgi:hypothetical protein
MQTLEALCRRLVLLYALALDLPADFFDACFAKPHMILRMSRYPVIDGEDETVASLVPHTDSGFMTLLPPNPVPGLSILLPSGRWIEAPGVEGAYVVNGGDILHRWTNERFLSTPHRVRNLSGQVRYAIPFFCDPDHDTNSNACRLAAAVTIRRNTHQFASATTAASWRARGKGWGSRLTRTYFGIAQPPASRSTTQRMSGSPPACSVIAPDLRRNATITKRAVSKRAGSCKNPCWRGVTTSSAPSPRMRSRDGAE